MPKQDVFQLTNSHVPNRGWTINSSGAEIPGCCCFTHVATAGPANAAAKEYADVSVRRRRRRLAAADGRRRQLSNGDFSAPFSQLGLELLLLVLGQERVVRVTHLPRISQLSQIDGCAMLADDADFTDQQTSTPYACALGRLGGHPIRGS